MNYDLTHFRYCKSNFYLSFLKLYLLVSSSSNNKKQAEGYFLLPWFY